MGVPREMLKKYGVSIDVANRHQYLEQKAAEIRLELDKVSFRVKNGEKIQTTEGLSPKAQDVLRGLIEQKTQLTEQLDNTYKQMEQTK